MPQLTVKYKNRRALEALQHFAKYFDYEILLPEPKEEKKKNKINFHGVTIIQGDSSINTDQLNKVFSSKNIQPSDFRKEAWQRKK